MDQITRDTEIVGVQYYILGNHENARDSCISIQSSEVSKGVGKPYSEGLQDLKMGTTEYNYNCITCLNNKTLCPGHCGDIELKYSIKQPLFKQLIPKYLKIICFKCGDLVFNRVKLDKYDLAPFKEPKKINFFMNKTKLNTKPLKCPTCGQLHPLISTEKKNKTDKNTKDNIIYEEDGVIHRLHNEEIVKIFSRVKKELLEFLDAPEDFHPSKLLIKIVRVPPNTIRPEMKKMDSNRSNLNDITRAMQNIFKLNEAMPKMDNIEAIKNDQDLNKYITLIEIHYDEIIKGSSATAVGSKIVSNSKKEITSIRKLWVGKQGRVRRNLNGRRTNNMLRSVITGDPYIEIDEVGLPIAIARTIQRPIVVREYNYNECMIYFMNGKKKYPGCSKIQTELGREHDIGSVPKDFQLKVGMTLWRDLITGDVMDFGRQPSLLFCSICCHRIKVLEHGDTLTMNVMACPLYNADFDGDAMLGLPARSLYSVNEITELSHVGQHFLSLQHSAPIIGAFQDGLIGVSELTRDAVVADKFHAMQLMSQTSNTYIFDKETYTGRDLISMLLPPINLNKRPTWYNESFKKYIKYSDTETEVVIDRGILKKGILDKSTVGQKAVNGIYHIIHNEYGSRKALETTYKIQQLTGAFLNNRGYTINMNDIIISDKAKKKVHDIVQNSLNESNLITKELNEGELIAPIGQTVRQFYEQKQMNVLSTGDDFNEAILTDINAYTNNLYKLIWVGSKGSMQNFYNIGSAIGQLSIGGERLDFTFGFNRTMPYYTAYSTEPKSRGYIENSYYDGLEVDEFFSHTMEARYGINNRALSTSVTGDQERKSIKNLESIIYDNLRKASKPGVLIQPLYGYDGVDPRYLEDVIFPTVMISDKDLEDKFCAQTADFDKIYQNETVAAAIKIEFKQIVDDRNLYRKIFIRAENQSNSNLLNNKKKLPINVERVIKDIIFDLYKKDQKPLDPIKAIETLKTYIDKLPYILINSIQESRGGHIPDHMKVSFTLFNIILRSLLCTKMLIKNNINIELLEKILEKIKISYKTSLMEYGTSVGIIAAQSFSEPQTQMVLNSHHRSGGAGSKVSGIVRIKEIMSAKETEKMKGPSMTIFIKPEYESDKIKVQEIANNIEMMRIVDFEYNNNDWQIFYEEYGVPKHPKFIQEAEMVKKFNKQNPSLVPSDLTKWCIRIHLNKLEMITKNMRAEIIYNALRLKYNFIHIVYTSENDDEVVFRIYMRNGAAKKGSSLDKKQVEDYCHLFRHMVIRGVEGIIAARVLQLPRTIVDEFGAITTKDKFYIDTDGTNLLKMLENKYIDANKIQTNSVLELCKVFGPDAAYKKIITELRSEIDNISYRHYTLYADEMIRNGTVTSIERYGLSKREGANILLRVSDAAPAKILEEAAYNSSFDNIKGISAPIIIGKEPRIGTLYNDVMLNEKFIKENIKNSQSIIDEL